MTALQPRDPGFEARVRASFARQAMMTPASDGISEKAANPQAVSSPAAIAPPCSSRAAG